MAVTTDARPTAPAPRSSGPTSSGDGDLGHHRVAIIGAGFGGLGAAIRLADAGIDDVVILERADDVGGTWRDNHYPGCQCDVPSHLYSFSFAPNPGWTRSFAPQPEIQAYLQDCARRFGVLPKVRFGHEVLDATWREDAQRWIVTTTGGTLSADIVISAHGPLSEPVIPELPGLADFTGEVFHSATWDHDVDLAGRRVAVIGTGASAIQFVPAIAPVVGHMDVYQRSAAWVVPRPDQPIPARTRRLLRRLPILQRARRAGIYWNRELLVLGFATRPALMRLPEKVARAHLAAQVADPRLREALTPRYAIGCKRILLSNDWYPTFSRPNVDLVTEGIAEIRERSVVTADGTEREVDTIIFGTGFRTTDPPIASRIRGRNGETMAEAWADTGIEAYRGTTVTGFPNLFLLVGPNTGLGHTSIVFMIESQINYVLDALRTMDEWGVTSIDVHPEAQRSYNEQIHRELDGTVWNSGCASWYLDERGRNTTLWPTFTWRFRRETRRFDPAAYHLYAHHPVPAA